MTHRMVLWCCLVAAVGLAGTASAPASDAKGVVGVEELMRNVEKHGGTIRVEGVVSAVSVNRGTLSLIDIREFRECGVITCSSLTLPVRWAGLMPAVRDVVQFGGKVQEFDGKLVFVARTLQQVGLRPSESK